VVREDSRRVLVLVVRALVVVVVGLLLIGAIMPVVVVARVVVVLKASRLIGGSICQEDKERVVLQGRNLMTGSRPLQSKSLPSLRWMWRRMRLLLLLLPPLL